MTGILSKLKIVSEDLNKLDVSWALIGALAVSVHTEPRSTRDIDVAVAISVTEQDILVKKLLNLGYADSRLLMHVMPTHKMGVRLRVRGSGEIPLALDLLFSSSGIESEVVQQAMPIEIFPGILVRVACRGHLIAMKVLSQNDSDRIRDQMDLQQLLRNWQEEDILMAKEALHLMNQRGFHREKDLFAELKQTLQRHAPDATKLI